MSETAGAHGRRRRQRIMRTCFALALAVVTVLLLLPSDELPKTGVWDKFEHALTFAVLALLGTAAFPERRHAWWLAFGLIGFGAICEILQTWVPGRAVSFADGLANAVGVLVAAAALALFRKRTKPH